MAEGLRRPWTSKARLRFEEMMSRYAGDFQGPCTACGEYVEFALGIRTDGPPAAMHFGPGGPQPIELGDVKLVLMVDDKLDVKFDFKCPLCGESSAGRMTSNAVRRVGD